MRLFNLQDLAIILWLALVQPMLLRQLPAIGLNTLGVYSKEIFLFLLANYASLFLAGALYQYGWLKGWNKHSINGLGILFHPVVLLVIDVCFTLTLLSISLAFLNLDPIVLTILVMVFITAYLLYLAYLSNAVGERLDLSENYRLLTFIKELLALPAVVCGAEICRQLLAPGFWLPAGGIGIGERIVVWLVYLFILAPLGYYFLIIVFRSPLEMKQYRWRWLYRYLLFLTGLYLNLRLLSWLI